MEIYAFRKSVGAKQEIEVVFLFAGEVGIKVLGHGSPKRRAV